MPIDASPATLPAGGAAVLRPPPPPGLGRGALLSLLAHAGLLAALAFAVSWRSHAPQVVSAELWSAVPQVAAPAAASPPAPPPPPAVAPARPAAPPRAAEPARPNEAQIAIEKARERERQARIERDRQARERAERDKAARDQAAKAKAERDAQARAEAQQREQQAQRQAKEAQARLEQQRAQNVQRMLGQAGATGAPGATGSAARDAGPSASYAGKLIARVRPNIVLTEPVPGQPAAEVEVRAAPSGTILSRRLVKSSGSKAWDEAVLRALDRTGELPRDEDGRVPPVVIITFTP
jgi:colicin import membrane protein